VVCRCNSGYYGPGTTCSPCPANTMSDAFNTSTLLNCRCVAGYVCTYTKRITATVRIPNMTLATFTSSYQAAFLQAIATAAGVDVSHITIVSASTASRRLFSASVLTIEFYVRSVSPSTYFHGQEEHHRYYLMRRAFLPSLQVVAWTQEYELHVQTMR